MLTAAMLRPLPFAAGTHSHLPIAQVHFLATSVSVRNDYYDSEDDYLAEVQFVRRGDAAVLARLADGYAPSLEPIRSEILRAADGTRLRLLRDPSCDIVLADMPLRAAPGDPLAILPVQLEYRLDFPEAVEPEQILPGYRIVCH